MARTSVDDNLFINQTWKLNGKTKTMVYRFPVIVITNIYRKDRMVQYKSVESGQPMGRTDLMQIAELRRFYEPVELYIK